MQEDLKDAIDKMADQESILVSYVDRDPSHATGVGGGDIRIAYSSSPNRVTRFSLPKSQSIVESSLYMLLWAACRHAKLVYVDDLHHYLLRLNRPFSLPDHKIGDGALVIDLSFVRSWNGIESDEPVWDEVIKKSDPIEHCFSMVKAMDKRARWYYHKHYLPSIQSYVIQERRPISLWHDARKMFVSRWIQYQFNSAKTGRLIAKGSQSLDSTCFNHQCVKKEERRNYIRAKPGYKIVAIDYKAAEISMGACLSNDETIIDVLRNGGDPYGHIGTCIPNYPQTHEGRENIKTIMISGQAYGASIDTLAERTGLDHDAVRDIHRAIEKQYSNLHNWIHHVVGDAKEYGYIITPTGHKMTVQPERARTTAPNYMLQSITADANVVTFANIIKACDEDMPHIKPILHLYDCYLFQIPVESLDHDVEFLIAEAVKPSLGSKELRNLTMRVSCDISDYWE